MPGRREVCTLRTKQKYFHHVATFLKRAQLQHSIGSNVQTYFNSKTDKHVARDPISECQERPSANKDDLMRLPFFRSLRTFISLSFPRPSSFLLPSFLGLALLTDLSRLESGDVPVSRSSLFLCFIQTELCSALAVSPDLFKARRARVPCHAPT